jgi:hypothetical protein
MKNSIETIWKEGFLNESSLVAPRINDLYNRKSKHLEDRIKRLFRINLVFIGVMAIVLPLVHYFLDAIWQGVSASILMLLTGWYSFRQAEGIKALDPGATSLDYLRALDRWLKEVLLRSEKIARFYYPLCFLIALSTVWSAWNKQGEFAMETKKKLPDMIFLGNIPWVALVIAIVATILIFRFSKRIYRFDVRLMYGSVFGKLEATIAEMEKLKEDG